MTALGINGVIGSGIFLLPGVAVGMMGPASILSFAFAGFLCFMIALCFAEAGSRFSGTGGPYVYAREAFGGFMGFQVGWMTWWVRVISWAALANAFSMALADIVPGIGGFAAQKAVVTGVIVLLAAVNVRGVKTGAGLTNLFTVAKLIPLAVFLFAGAFFVKSATPHLLKDAPGGQDYLSTDQGQLTRGKIAFAENCAACHSSKQPPEGVVPDSPEQIQWFRDEVVKPDFLENNFLSDERRYSVAELGTNACSSLATNSLEGQVWASFSSKTFKSLPAVGRIEVYNPFTKQTTSYEMPGGGRGYTRTPSLVSMWSTAPFLLNNSVGKFTGDPSVAGRMAAFDDGIDKLLTPEKRRGVDSIYRTTEESFIVVNKAFLPKPLQTLLGLGKWLPGWMPMSTNELRIGPIPKGTPVGLLASLDLEISKERIPELIKVLRKTVKTLKRIKKENLSSDQSTELLRSELASDLLALSKCPDFITDRGHEYGSDLPVGDKKALIEFLKTF